MITITINDITTCLEKVAPLSFKESFDNPGLAYGNPDAPCTGVFVCLDVSEEVVEKAAKANCNLIVSHHPLIFRGLKNLLATNNVNRTLLKAIEHGIALYSSHTNLDAARLGVNTLLAKKLGISNFTPFQRERSEGNYFGIGGVGELESPIGERDFLLMLKQRLNIPSIRYVSGSKERIQRVALCSGSGAEFIPDAIECKADAFLCGDIKYHQFLDAEGQILLADIGHFESEAHIKEHIISIISENFCNFVPLLWDEAPNRVKSI